MTTAKKIIRYTPFGILGIIIMLLAVATIAEKSYGSKFVYDRIYCAVPMLVLWGMLAFSALICLLRSRIAKNLSTFMLHISFLLILAGALITHLCGIQGSVHLRTGSTATTSFTATDGSIVSLPFALSLYEFSLKYYTGTSAPMDYVSSFTIIDGNDSIDATVSMNNIFTYRNYRFYQSGYDRDNAGTTLAISHDPYGIAISYTGYICLLLAMIGFLFSRRSIFRSLLNNPALKRVAAAILTAGSALSASAAESFPKVLPAQVAAQFGDLHIYYNDRICPLQTMAKDFTVKLYGKERYRGLTPEQVVTGWFFFYDDWKREPMIKIKGEEIRNVLGLHGKYACLLDFTDNNGYKLDNYRQGNPLATVLRDIDNANEKFNLVSMLCTGSLLKIYPYTTPTDSSVRWYSLAERLPADMPDGQWSFIRNSMNYIAEKVAMKDYTDVTNLLSKIRKYQIKEGGEGIPSANMFAAEKLYNSTSYIKWLAMLCLAIGMAGFITAVLRKGITSHFRIAYISLLYIILAYLTFHISLRWYISGHVPLSNGFETMQFTAWCSVGMTLLIQRRFYLALPFGFLLCGLALLVAMMGESNPQITQLMPVLQSPLLSIHVVVIMASYSLLAFTMLNGIAAIILRYTGKAADNSIEYLQLISRIMLYPAVFLLAAGIFIGAVWANISWGRYWGWDPKEVWALITMLVYAFALHPSSLPVFKRPMFFHLYCVFAFITVLVTYFGVNFFLGGMHSYA